MNLPDASPAYKSLLNQIASVYTDGQKAAVQSVPRTLLLTYWQIGQTIVEFEQGGQARSDYGSQVLPRLSRDLSDQFGKRFSRSNLISMRLLYRRYSEKAPLSDQLTWAHYVEGDSHFSTNIRSGPAFRLTRRIKLNSTHAT